MADCFVEKRLLAIRAGRFLGIASGIFLAICLLVFISANLLVWGSTVRRIHYDPATLPDYPVAIIFGTARYLRGGGYNPHYMNRIAAVVKLYREGRIQHILVSGDNAHISYNEPIRMYRDLRKRGIPTQAITLDYAGFSTFDTIVRAKRVFGLKRAILVTQDWHLPRALYIAHFEGLQTAGYVAADSSFWGGIKLRIREWVARLATLGDLFIWQRKPRFLGPVEPISGHPADTLSLP